jgi:diguanylate cyclase (GGDEF)-like protein
MRESLEKLEQALFHHEEWREALTRTLICNLSPDQRDIDNDAQRKCRFGQWLYSPSSQKLTTHPSFIEIESSHTRMHHCATHMLKVAARREPIPLETYERFNNALKQMRLEALTTKKELEDALYNLDPLTGIASRIGMLTKLREQQSLVQRNVHSCSVAMIDLDYFKRINDRYGHAKGDETLVTFARRAMDHLRPNDLLFRYGGEEFLICAPNSDLKSGYDALDRLRRDLTNITFEAGDGSIFHITASFGLTLLDPDVSVEQSIVRADKALLAAKSAGRNRVVVWDPSMDEDTASIVPEPSDDRLSTAPRDPILGSEGR